MMSLIKLFNIRKKNKKGNFKKIFSILKLIPVHFIIGVLLIIVFFSSFFCSLSFD